MNLIRVASLAAVAVFALSACAVPGADSFRATLAEQYTGLSTKESEPMYDWTDKAYFASKGARAAAGVDVQPEVPATWGVGKEYLVELNNAYDMLQIALVPDNKKNTMPVEAARAQAYFDCWVEQRQEKWTPPADKDCRLAFYDAFNAMYGKEAAPSADNLYRVLFNTDSSVVDAEGVAAVAKAVEAFNDGGEEIIVAGHADRVGNVAYNQALSARRSAAVKAALVAAGVPANAVQVKSFGESQPTIGTPDEVAQRLNRRVVLLVR